MSCQLLLLLVASLLLISLPCFFSQPSNNERQGMGGSRVRPLPTTREARRQGHQGRSPSFPLEVETRQLTCVPLFPRFFRQQILAQNNIKTFEDLASDSMRIERLLNKKAPFGAQVSRF